MLDIADMQRYICSTSHDNPDTIYGSSKYEIKALNIVLRDGCDPMGFLSGIFIHDKIHRRDYWQDSSL